MTNVRMSSKVKVCVSGWKLDFGCFAVTGYVSSLNRGENDECFERERLQLFTLIVTKLRSEGYD